MNIYKYGLTQEKVIYVLECPVIDEKQSPRDGRRMYEIQENKKKTWIYEEDLETYSNKTMYSASGDNKMDFVKKLKEASEATINNYLKKAEDTRNILGEVLKINNLI